MAKINFDAATKGNPGISTCAVVIKEDEQHFTYTHELGEMDNHTAEWAACIYA
ncbi:TPA: ribonuclease H, partial [Staphylococcus aureus]|nr:ribonuclease H [Staphylococcus aureus]